MEAGTEEGLSQGTRPTGGPRARALRLPASSRSVPTSLKRSGRDKITVLMPSTGHDSNPANAVKPH